MGLRFALVGLLLKSDRNFADFTGLVNVCNGLNACHWIRDTRIPDREMNHASYLKAFSSSAVGFLMGIAQTVCTCRAYVRRAVGLL